MITIDVTWISYVMAAVVIYYGALFAIAAIRGESGTGGAGRPSRTETDPLVVIVVPARNEELVIEDTLRSLIALDYQNVTVMVVNDGSDDETSVRAHRFETSGRVVVVDRAAEIAGRGKGDVLNHAHGLLNQMLEDSHPLLHGHDAEHIVVGVMDADGQLDRDALHKVAPYFDDARVGGTQIGVRIANATDGLLTRMQDMEFVGFSRVVQRARDWVGSVGLGGNGQFTRLSALNSLGVTPWTACLSEDLDLGLSLVEQGWRIRFCSTTFVAQQGLRRLRPLIRQRARWIQGHYQCWRHVPSILTSRRQRLSTRIDLVLYLLMVTFVMLVFANATLGLASMFGLVVLQNDFVTILGHGMAARALIELLSFGPLVIFVCFYQTGALDPLHIWELPAYTAAFALYAYYGVGATLWAWMRMILGRKGWSKTQRVLEVADVEASAADS